MDQVTSKQDASELLRKTMTKVGRNLLESARESRESDNQDDVARPLCEIVLAMAGRLMSAALSAEQVILTEAEKLEKVTDWYRSLSEKENA